MDVNLEVRISEIYGMDDTKMVSIATQSIEKFRHAQTYQEI